jgi:hypothetical protein
MVGIMDVINCGVSVLPHVGFSGACVAVTFSRCPKSRVITSIDT